MKTLHGIMVAGALAVLACAAPGAAFAQDGNQNDRNQDRRQTQNAQDRSRQSQANRGDVQKGEISGQGEIRRTKKVGIKGKPVEHLVVLFRAPDSDRDRIADLGPVKNLKNADIRSGDNLRMIGRVVKVGDQQVLMVRKFYTEENPDKAIVVVRKSKDQKSSRQNQSRPSQSRQNRGSQNDS